MSLLRKIIKNKSGETKNIMNCEIANNDEYDIPANLWLKLSGDILLHNEVSNGNFVVNDGEVDLSPELGVRHCKGLSPSPILGITFTYSGQIQNGSFLSYANNMNQWILIPAKCVWTAWTWINDLPNRTFELLFYKNGLQEGNIFHTYSIENSESVGLYETNLNIILEAGDIIKIKHLDGVAPPENLVCCFYIEVF